MGKEIESDGRFADQSVAAINPWVGLPLRAPFYLPGDQEHLSVLPVPYVGVPSKAQLVLLQLNPGLSRNESDLMNDAYYVDQNRKALTFESRVPFWPLDERLAGTPGHVYWKAKLRWLAAELGDDFLRERLFCAEFYPYHSKEFYGPREPVPSQAFAFGLVRGVMKRNVPIVVMRGKELWESVIPELSSYPNRFDLHGRNAAISPGNMGPGEFAELVGRIHQAHTPAASGATA